ncbi:MAG: anti-sigma factor [Gemmatimonadaceae bacterium]
MTHELSDEKLHEYIHDELSLAARISVEEHLEVCERCRGEVIAARKLASRVSSLAREIQPARDLWPAIRARHAGVLRLPSATGSISRTGGGIYRVRLAAAAAVLILASSGVTALVLRRDSGDAAAPAAETRRGAAYFASRAEERLTEADYVQAARDLSLILAERRASLSPHTVRIVEQNLGVIDAAIRESSDALARDPGNQDLSQMVANSYRQKVELLRQATRSLVEL